MQALLSIVLFVAGGLLLGLVGLGAGRLVRPKNPHPEKAEAYECGELPIGSAQVQFDLRFYIIALIYLVFAVEVVLFYPWAVSYGSADQSAEPFTTRAVALVDMLVFFALIVVGFAYLWRFGYLGLDPLGTEGAVVMKRSGSKVLDAAAEAAGYAFRVHSRSRSAASAAASLSALLLCTSLSIAQTSPYDAIKPDLQQRIAEARKAADHDPDKKVWDFVIADRKAKTVTVLSCGTNIKPTDPAEFFVAPVVSGKDYESLAVTFATPGDVRAALQFIGLQPGQPIDPDKNRLWPRGPRVVMTYTIAGKPVRAESLILDTNTDKPLPESGLVYTGSYTYTDEQGKPHVAADESDARPIAPTYNDPAALFDVPDQAPQSVVYGFRKPSPAWTVKPSEAVDVVLTAATGENAVEERSIFVLAKRQNDKTVYDLSLPTGKFGPPVGHNSQGNPIYDRQTFADLPHLVARLAESANGNCDLFTRVITRDDVPVHDVRNLYAVLEAVQKDRGVKISAPSDDDLFYRAFFPQPQWRDRATRLGEPWELFLTRDAKGVLHAKLERSVDNPDRTSLDTKIVESSTPADPAAFTKEVNDKATRWSRAIFVYPPADLTYGELMTWVRPALPTYPRVFVFPAESPTTAPAPTEPEKK